MLADFTAPMRIWDGKDLPAQQLYVVDSSGYPKEASNLEWNVAMALDELQLEYKFQVQFWGGTELMGGMILDFLVFTVPRPTPLWVMGAYWHAGEAREQDELKRMFLNNEMGGSYNLGVFIYEQECSTIQTAINTLRRKIMV